MLLCMCLYMCPHTIYVSVYVSSYYICVLMLLHMCLYMCPHTIYVSSYNALGSLRSLSRCLFFPFFFCDLLSYTWLLQAIYVSSDLLSYSSMRGRWVYSGMRTHVLYMCLHTCCHTLSLAGDGWGARSLRQYLYFCTK